MFGDVLTNLKGLPTAPFGNFVSEMHLGPFGSALKNECFVPRESSYCMVYEQKHAIQKRMDVETRYIDEAKYKQLKRFSVYPGDILVSCRGTIGECFQIPCDAPMGVIHPSVMMLRANENVEPEFLMELLQRIMAEQLQTGTGVKMAITANALSNIVTIAPKRDSQRLFLERKHQINKLRFI